MNSLLTRALTKLIRNRYALFKTLIVSMLVLSLTACGGKAVSQDVSIKLSEPIEQKDAQLSRKISEVAPPEIIQELRQTLEVYQPQVKILNPQPEEVLQEDKLQVSLQVKDLPIFKNVKYGLGSHLKVILDNQPELEVYDLSQPLELVDLSPGTHTLRVFASRPWHESFKNEGAYAQTKFHVFTKSDDNNPDSNLPILTYNHPQGSYGAEPILLDFYLTNAPLHLLAKDNPDSAIADWRIRCTINGESFIIDRWQSLYLKGFNPGKNWVKLEFIDNQGNPVKNVFNSTVRVINYESKGKDTLAKIVRGELVSEDLRGIVDANYAVEIPSEKQVKESEESEGGFFKRFKRGEAEKTPTPEVIETPQPETNLEETIPEVIETPQPETNLEETIPEVIETPQLETNLEETIPEVIETPQPETNLEEKSEQPRGFFDRFKRGKEDKTTIPEVIKTPQAETNLDLEETIPKVIETPIPEITPEFPTKETPTNTKLEPKIEPTPELPPTLPEIIQPLKNKPQIEISPEAKQSTTKKLKEYFNLPRRTVPEVSPEVEIPQDLPLTEQPTRELIEE
ncbi:hypothetical protein IQ247_17595 [Plectonema cf. radiosum LEGE 06105]|uniref:FHA domain containing protein n=1 Tax=Plectonema cf. radiosum LEGE 06105 TaxID=945769 RepID=A0A8J7FA38_9CYAN|nr:hypothetical protein [Plectonema radiosum]MBE9214459.1 hypothetical protein [Plectonema cf. radiosum LEGE 06105]